MSDDPKKYQGMSIAKIGHVHDLILQRPEFARELTERELLTIKDYYNKELLRDSVELSRLKASNKDPDMSFSTIDNAKEVLAVVNARLIELYRTETFTNKTREQLQKNGRKGGRPEGPKYPEVVDQINKMIQERPYEDWTVARIVTFATSKGISNPNGKPITESWVRKGLNKGWISRQRK